MKRFDLVKYYDGNMNLIDTAQLITTHLHIPSIPFSNKWVGGEDGIIPIFMGADQQQKSIVATIELISDSFLGYHLLRDYLYSIFGFNELFYIVDKSRGSKRHKVILENDFMPKRYNSINGTVDIPFITQSTPYAESIGTTADINRDGYNTDLWQGNMGLDEIKEPLYYSYTGNYFGVFNAGNVGVHPFEHDLKITISGVVDSTSFLQLKNNTNGSMIRFTEPIKDSDTIVIDGPNVLINSLNAFRKTNRSYIHLSPGWNYFSLTGASLAVVSFDFRFYYL